MAELTNESNKDFLFKVNRNEWGVLEIETEEETYVIDFDLRDGSYFINSTDFGSAYTRRYASNFETKNEAFLALIEDLSI
jgi:hypothetical protein